MFQKTMPLHGLVFRKMEMTMNAAQASSRNNLGNCAERRTSLGRKVPAGMVVSCRGHLTPPGAVRRPYPEGLGPATRPTALSGSMDVPHPPSVSPKAISRQTDICRITRLAPSNCITYSWTMPEDFIFENAHFLVEHSHACAIPGYVIVTAKAPASSLSSLSQEALVTLGPTLSAIIKAIESVVAPERVYCAQFGEETSQLHFHVFPRTRAMADEYAQAAHGPMSGPCLLDWARKHYRAETAPPAVIASLPDVIEALRRVMVSRPSLGF